MNLYLFVCNQINVLIGVQTKNRKLAKKYVSEYVHNKYPKANIRKENFDILMIVKNANIVKTNMNSYDTVKKDHVIYEFNIVAFSYEDK